uniref:Uncharacterized protein n=1 Tax=Cacopsylla melanoneura TaxID=428564 RepID=A0A8D9AXS7_9HEMI
MQEIQKLVNFLSATTFMEHFQDILFLRIKKSRPIPSRLAASKTLLVLLTKLDNESLTSKCISRIHKDLYCSRSFYDRNLFVKICHQTIQMLSFEEFKKYFLPSLILLSADPVPNIRYSVTGLLVHSSVRLMCCPTEQATPTELTTRIEQCLGELKNDPDVDVSANVNSLVSKLKEKRASALLNLLIEPAIVVQEDLEDQIPPNTLDQTNPIQEGVPSRSVIIHPYMKASLEKEFLIDTGIPFNSTPMSENYNKQDSNKSLDTNKQPKSSFVSDSTPDGPTSPNINNNIGLIKSYQDTSGVSSKEARSKDIILNDNSHYDNNGNLALHDIQRKTSKLGMPKKFGFHEKISGNEKVNGLHTSVVDSGLSTDEMCLPPPPPPYNDNETNCTIKYKEQIQNSYQTSSKQSGNNDTTNFESIPKNNINELYVHGKTYQSTNQTETHSNSSHIMLRYQMVKPKNIVRENEPNQSGPNQPNQSGTNLGINSPGSKLKRAYMSSVNNKQNIIEPRKDGNSTKDISYNQSEPKGELEERVNNVEQKSTPELKPKNNKKPSLLAPISFNRVLLSPKDQKRKSVHIMESYQNANKKSSEDCNINPIEEKNTNTEIVSTPSTQHKDNLNREPVKQSIEMSFQNKRKSMYQPSDRDSLLTSFFKGQTLKYQPKDMIQRKDAISCSKKEPNLETKPENPPSPENPPLSQTPISNTLPRIHKFSYQNQLPGPNFRKCKIPEGQVQKKESTKSPEKVTNDAQIVSSNLNISMNNLNKDCNRNITPSLTNTILESNEESKIKEKNNSDPITLNTEIDKKYSPSTTRQHKINHLDLQNNEFIFYKNKNCSDVEVGHVDSPRNSVVSDQETSTTLMFDNNSRSLNIHKQMNVAAHQENSKPCAENDITQKILNLTNEVETIDQYLNLESNSNTTNLPQNITISPIKVDIMQSPCTQSINPLKIDIINSPSNPKEDPVNPNKNLNAAIPPSGMKRSPNLEKKKVMFLNEKMVTPDECQRLSLSFERELMELNSKIEEINEEIRVETLNLQQAKIENIKNNVNQNSSQIVQPNSPQGYPHLPKFNAISQIVRCEELNEITVSQEQDVMTLETRNMLQHTPPPTRRVIEHKHINAIAEEPLDESKDTKKLNTAAFVNTNPAHQNLERTPNEVDNEPPTLHPRAIPENQETKTYASPVYPSDTIQQPMLHPRVMPKTNVSPEPRVNATPEYPNDNLDLDTEDRDEQHTLDDSRVFRESKLLKRHAYRRSYDERISKIDFHGFSKKSDVNNGTSFNKHSTYRRSFDDRNFPNASETVGPNLPPKVPVMPATPTPISSEQKKISNYQVFSDRRKNILENKSFTVRIGSRSTAQNGKKTPRDISPSLSNSSKNSNVPQVKHKVNMVDNETNNTSQSRSITPEFRSINTQVSSKEQHLGKTSSLIGKPRVSVSPLKYSTASAIKSIPVVSTTPSIPQIPQDQVTLRKRSISPQTTQAEDNSANGKLPERNQHVEVPWRRPMSRMQAPRSISQIIESQIPGLNDEHTAPPPPPPPREKSIPDISRNIPTASQIKPRLISKSPSPSKMIQPRCEPTIELNQQKKPIPPPTRQYKVVENVKPADDRLIKPIALAETGPSELKGKVSGENITKIIKVGPSTAFGYNRNESSVLDVHEKSGDTKLTTVVTVKRTSSSGSNESLLRFKKSQGNSNDSLTNRSEANSEASDSSKIPGKKNFKPSKFSCLRSDQDSFYKNNCHIGTEERPRSCIILPNGSHPGKANDNLKSISEENLQQNNRRASSAGAIPQPSGGGSKLPRRSIKF